MSNRRRLKRTAAGSAAAGAVAVTALMVRAARREAELQVWRQALISDWTGGTLPVPAPAGATLAEVLSAYDAWAAEERRRWGLPAGGYPV